VIGLSSPRWTDDEWTDDELLRELRAALQEPPVAEKLIRAAEAAFTWRTVDADLEILSLESGLAMSDTAQVRGAEQGSPRRYAFHGERLSVEIEIDEDGIVGQLTPPGPARVTLVTPDGPQAAADADEVGCFTLPAPRPGPMRLDCQRDRDRFLTEWTST
jgi:hypothetical protein